MTVDRELRVQDIQKAYKGRRVVEGVSLQLKTGEIIGLLCPNGAGKTTSFYMITTASHLKRMSSSISRQEI